MSPDPSQSKAAAFTRRHEVEADQPFLLALCDATFAAQFAPLNLPAPMLEMLMRQQFHAQSTGYLIRFPAARREIIEADGAPVGRLISDRDSQRLRLVDIAFIPSWRGRGLGAAVIRQLMDEARVAGTPIELHVTQDNVRAARLYARLGFETVATDDVHREMRWTPLGA